MAETGKNRDKLEGNREYFDNADIFVQDRKHMLAVLASFYRKFILPKPQRKVLDLGTGDGILVRTIAPVDPGLRVTASDGFADISFSRVDCHYKCGVFAIFGGQRPQSD